MNKYLLGKLLSLLTAGALVLQLAACGTIIYPERRGQTRGDIDPAIAILDGIGLLFFIVPGLIAFAIDFATGAIYLPRGKRSQQRVDELREKLGGRLEVQGDRLVLYLQPQQMTPEVIEAVVAATSGTDFQLDRSDLAAYRLGGTTELPAAFARLERGPERLRLAAL